MNGSMIGNRTLHKPLESLRAVTDRAFEEEWEDSRVRWGSKRRRPPVAWRGPFAADAASAPAVDDSAA